MPSRQMEEIFLQIKDLLDLKLDCLSDGLIYRFSKGPRSLFIYGFYLDVNPSGAVEICKDKEATARVLQHASIACIDHRTFYMPNKHPMIPMKDNLKDGYDYAKKHRFSVVVKPPGGAGGGNVYFSQDEKEFQAALSTLLSQNLGICISPRFDSLFEYRVYVLNNQAEITYKKVRPSVLGDGIHTLGELATQYVQKRQHLSPLLKAIPPHIFFDRTIPSKDEPVILTKQHNLAFGASADLEIEPHLKNALQSLALKAANAVGISFASVDLMIKKNGELSVLEINPGIAFDCFLAQHGKEGEKLVKEIYIKAIKQVLT
jgi:D-alanine-D-alanine ligase-like ATP-grasp enzyme